MKEISKACKRTCGQGWRERAEASLGRERTRLQIWYQDLLTHAAEANDVAVSLDIMCCSRSSLITAKPVVAGDIFSFFVDDDDDEAAGDRLSISIQDWPGWPGGGYWVPGTG